MMRDVNLYRFSPIRTREQLIDAVRYVVAAGEQLSKELFDKAYPILSVTIFAHFPDEYTELQAIVETMGIPQEKDTRYIHLSEPIKINEGEMINLLRIRSPDPYRMQVGCINYDVPTDMIKRCMQQNPNNIRIIEGAKSRLVELFTPSIDVLIYIKDISMADKDDKKTTLVTGVKLYADGGSRGNPGPSAYGFVLMDEGDNIITEQGSFMGYTTNNQAEYRALLEGLKAARALGSKNVQVYMDSMLVTQQMKGLYKVKNKELWAIHEAVRGVAQGFDAISYIHIPRELNRLADAQVNKALDAHASPEVL